MRRATVVTVCALLAVCASAEEAAQKRPESWAEPLTLSGVPNLHKVSDVLYRSAQPSAEGMKNLKAKGVATIVNLRSFHSDRDEIGKTDLGYEHIYMKAWHPERKEAVRFLQIMNNPKRRPVLVHCLHGSDRTGTMCALYRIALQGWTKEEAIREMRQGGYGFHEIFKNLPEWIRGLDIDSLRKDAGIEAPTKKPTPSLGRLKTRDKTITITGGPEAPLYTVQTLDGRALAVDLPIDQLTTRFPELQRVVERGIADWAGM